ncbi:hypothetical protein [Candidatus Pelagibacter sp.]|uniref:hypothetical protein n=1 Tax=Candidatus Pelagibacter sp. TaxID=2024849 RepID=UPI003F832FC9
MKKILLILIFILSWSNPVYANIYLIELGLGGSGGIGAIFILLIILYGAFFGSKIAKAIIWGWVMFFVTFWYVLNLFQPDLNFTKAMISFGIAFIVLMIFMFIAEKEKQKDEEESKIKHNLILKNLKRKKKKKRNIRVKR